MTLRILAIGDVGNIMYDHSSNYLATIVNATERTRIASGGAFKAKVLPPVHFRSVKTETY